MSRWQQEIEEDLAWREAELAALKIQAAQCQKESTRYNALLRALCAMLYAHYEGFCKFVWEIFLDALEGQHIKREEFKEEIALLSLTKEFRRLRGNLSPSEMWNFCNERFRLLMSEQIRFDMRLETESNLWPHLLVENSLRMGLTCRATEEHSTVLKALVARRNDIAHGQRMVIQSLDDYQAFENAAFAAMYELALEVVECLDQRRYLKHVITSPGG